MELIHEHLYKLIKDKYGITSASITGDSYSFTVIVNGEVVKTEKDFTSTELSNAENAYVLEIQQAEKAILEKRSEVLAKLGITSDEAKLLLS
jgi:hypothetical protein